MFPFERTRPYDVGILLVHGIGSRVRFARVYGLWFGESARPLSLCTVHSTSVYLIL